MPLTRPFSTLSIARPDATVRWQLLHVMQGDPWVQLIEPGAPSSVRSSLGIPEGLLVVLLNVYNPLGWVGYHFALRGTWTKDTAGAATAPTFWLRCETAPDTWINIPLAAWERLVGCPGTDLYVESRWNPVPSPIDGKYIHTDIRGFEGDTRAGSFKIVRKGIKLLEAMEMLGGRPQGSREWSEAEFRQAYPDMYQLLFDTYESRPKRYEVAEALHIDPKTFREYLKAWHLPFPPF